ncbi:beta-ketoacyl synthase [Plantactinospora sp. KBS50]|uniref:beta-ketoacyl-[acyl-carrier-protein] synthase family protein n=1 Tax=Plantactinospora sp. KBS50 TaxID=2024580 RepID=UPI0018E05721|nr:beta-ketoacyl synthase N-terminal-like domain-containing protein [Plantactinospora sp. KBS50]
MPTDQPRVAVTGLGAVSAAGLGADRLWAAVRAGRVLTGPVTRFDLSRYPTRRAGQVPDDAVPALDAMVPPHRSRAARYLAAAVREALADADPPPEATLGLYVGSVMATRPTLDAGIGPAGLAVPDRCWADPAGLLGPVRAVLGRPGPVLLLASGCSAGNGAIAAGYRAVLAGEVDVAVCAGVEELSLEIFAMFTALRALAPDVVRPFDADRRGTMPAEGAGVVILERADRCAARGVRPRAAVLACASAADGHHMTQPHPEGTALVATLQAVLDDAGVEPDDLDWVCAHGTGTPANDGVEARAVLKVLAGRRRPAVSSVKGQLGHAAGAAAALEAVLAVRALADGVIPGNVTLRRPDPAADGLDLVPAEGRRQPVSLVASPGYGFGGGVTTLLLGRGDRDGH